MAEASRVQLPRPTVWAARLAIFWLLLIVLVAYLEPLSGPVGTDPTNPEIASSASLPVFMWCMGWPIAFTRRQWWESLRFPWALGSVLLLIHVALAFHLGH